MHHDIPIQLEVTYVPNLNDTCRLALGFVTFHSVEHSSPVEQWNKTIGMHNVICQFVQLFYNSILLLQ